MRLERFGFVFQFHFLLPELSVIDNVMLPMRQLGRLGGGRDALAAPTICSPRSASRSEARKVPGELSGGQRQRVGDRARARQRSAIRARRRADRRARFEERRRRVLDLPPPGGRGPHGRSSSPTTRRWRERPGGRSTSSTGGWRSRRSRSAQVQKATQVRVRRRAGRPGSPAAPRRRRSRERRRAVPASANLTSAGAARARMASETPTRIGGWMM